MSRIILTRYPTGQEHVVVGYDHPCGGCFWQEFTPNPADGVYPDDFNEIVRDGGFFPGIPLEHFYDSVPEDLQPLVTDQVMRLLTEHAADPDSGYRRNAIDLSL
jgi:hypothetical protein